MITEILLGISVPAAGVQMLYSLEQRRVGKQGMQLPEFTIAAIIIGITTYGLVALCLAAAGIFTAKKALLIFTALNSILFFLIMQARHSPVSFEPVVSGRPRIALGVVFLLSLLYIPSAESIIDGRDNGMYALSAAAMVEQHNVVWRWDNLCSLANVVHSDDITPQASPLLIKDPETCTVVNDGFDFWPAVLSLGYVIGGLEGISMMYSIVGALGLLLIYYATLRFFNGDSRIALLCAGFYAVNMAVLFSIRIGVTEGFSSALSTAIILLLLLERHRDTSYIIALFLLFLGVLLTHPFNYLLLLPLSVLFANEIGSRKTSTFAAAALMAACLVAFWYGNRYEASYSELVKSIVYPLVTVSVVVSVLWGLCSRSSLSERIIRAAASLYSRHIGSIAVLVIAIAFYAYFLRPRYDLLDLLKGITAKFDYLNVEGSSWTFRRFGYYMTSAGVLGGIIGCLAWSRDPDTKVTPEKTAALLSIGFFSVLCLSVTSPHDWHFFTARRYTVLVSWGFLLFLSYFIIRLLSQKKVIFTVVAVALLGIYIANAMYVLAPYLAFIEEQGNNRFLRTLSAELPKDAPILVRYDSPIGSRLKFIANRNIIPYRNLTPRLIDSLSAHYHANGRKLYILASATGEEQSLMDGGHSAKLVKDYLHLMPGSQQVRETVPRGKVKHRYPFRLLEIISDLDAASTTLDLKQFGVWRGVYADGWTENRFSVAFSVPVKTLPRNIRLKLSRPGRLQEGEDPSVSISLNGAPLKTINCHEKCETEIMLPGMKIRTGTGEKNIIEFVSSSGIIPKLYNINHDTRSLHFIVEECITVPRHRKIKKAA